MHSNRPVRATLATTVSVSGSGTTYVVSVSGITSDGTLIASIPAGMVHDLAGNLNTASTSTDNSVRFIFAGPAATRTGDTRIDQGTEVHMGGQVLLTGCCEETLRCLVPVIGQQRTAWATGGREAVSKVENISAG